MEMKITPWGFEILLVHTDKYAAKKLFVFPGQRLSRQYHERKTESLVYLSGDGYVELGDDNHRYSVNFKRWSDSSLLIQPRVIHRICAYEETHLELLEMSTPELDDVVRLEDDYGRLTENRTAV